MITPKQNPPFHGLKKIEQGVKSIESMMKLELRFLIILKGSITQVEIMEQVMVLKEIKMHQG